MFLLLGEPLTYESLLLGAGSKSLFSRVNVMVKLLFWHGALKCTPGWVIWVHNNPLSLALSQESENDIDFLIIIDTELFRTKSVN